MASFDKILDWENNKLSTEEALLMFQELVDSGDIWRLPEEYQTRAGTLFLHGHITIITDKKKLN